LIMHPLTRLLVTREQQHGEQVACIAILLATPRDDLIHYLVQGAACGLKAATARCRNAKWREGSIEILREQPVHGCHCLADHSCLIAQITVEEGLACDTQRQAQHLRCNIHRLISLGESLPLIEQRDSSTGDQRTKGSHALSMESWLHQAPLLEPGFPVIGNE